jgi:hypothetical protein
VLPLKSLELCATSAGGGDTKLRSSCSGQGLTRSANYQLTSRATTGQRRSATLRAHVRAKVGSRPIAVSTIGWVDEQVQYSGTMQERSGTFFVSLHLMDISGSSRVRPSAGAKSLDALDDWARLPLQGSNKRRLSSVSSCKGTIIGSIES